MKSLKLLIPSAVLVAGMNASAALPATGVDLPTAMTDGITLMGTFVAVVVGGYVAFKAIKVGLRWVGRLFG